MADESPEPDQQGMPPDPVSMLAAGAAQLHELFAAYVTAGFLRHEALYLTGMIITAGMRNAQPPDAPPQAS